MTMIPFLIGIPVLFALIFPFMRESRSRGIMVYTGAGIVMLTTVIFIVQWLAGGAETLMLYPSTELVDHLMAAGDIILMCLIVYLSIKYRRILPILLSVGQTVLMLYTEFSTEVAEGPHMSVDWLTILMCIIIAFIGGFICIYTVGYMKGYHAHHTDVQDRQPFFFSMLFLFLAAMFGLVFSQNLIWMYFFWEITSVISFLMIGYTRTDEAVNNSFCALWMNLLGGLGFAAGITWMAFMEGTVQLLDVISAGAEVPLICLALAGLGGAADLSCPGGTDQIRAASLFHLACGGNGGAYAFQRAASQCDHGKGRCVSADPSFPGVLRKYDRDYRLKHRRPDIYHGKYDGDCTE